MGAGSGPKATRVVEASPPTQAALGEPSTQFLVHRADGGIVLASRAALEGLVLVPHADAVLYQSALELLWFRDEERLSALDLRNAGAGPVLVARGLPDVNRLSVTHPNQTSETEDGCDLPYISLSWSEASKIEAFSVPAPSLRLENAAWLDSQRARPARSVGQRLDFEASSLRLPKRILDCEDREACGTSVAFAGRGLELVRVLDRTGGDCFRRACVLRDPQTGLFAAPPVAQAWSSAEKVERGPCGLYLFDQKQSAFLLGHVLCEPEKPCQELGGNAIGWREPGPVVGAPGAL